MTTVAVRPLIAAFAIVLVVAGVAGGLIILGSPGDERVNRLDRRRVEDLQGIEAAVNLYWTRHGVLPGSVADVASDAGVRISTRDPVTMEPYSYRPLDEGQFEVCAVFESAERPEASFPGFWSHEAGRQCFRPTARDPRRP